MSSKNYKVLKVFDFDGFTVDVIEAKTEDSGTSEGQPEALEDALLCSICLSAVYKNKDVILLCGHGFCRLCIARIIINSEDTNIKCPTLNCNQKIENMEIKDILGDENYQDLIDRRNPRVSYQRVPVKDKQELENM